MEVYSLPLSETGKPIPSGKGQLIKLPQPSNGPYILRFVIFSASEIVNKGVIHCNVPPPGVEFNRFKYYTHPINASFHNETHIDIVISSSGAFSYYITYLPVTDPYFNPNYVEIAINNDDENSDDYSVQTANTSRYLLSPNSSSVSLNNLSNATSSLDISENSSPSDSSRYLAVSQDTSDVVSLQEEPSQKLRNEYLEDYSRSCTEKFYFTVSAGFKLDGQPLSLNSLNIESIVSKWMGPSDTWREKLRLIKEKGYNMVHFTPLQERGQSNSPYSIYDQLLFDTENFPEGEKDVSDLVSYMEHNLKLLSLTDIVFNHTANNSDWLKDHPEAGYSSFTAPHLNPAIDLDNSLLEFSYNLKALGYPTFLNNINDLYNIMEGIRLHVLPMVKLWEYYVVNVETIKNEVINSWDNLKDQTGALIPEAAKSDLKKLAKFTVDYASVGFDQFGYARFKRSLDKERFISILITLLTDSPSLEDIAKQTISILNEINLPLYQEYDADVKEIQSQLFSRINFTRLDPSGPKFGEINNENPLIETYFTRVKTRPHGKVVELANNGWIWNGNPLVDFASEKSKAYLRREVIIWGDCVKLRYGKHPSESPYLWDRMTKYTQLLAKYFHGIRVDNCHSTPLHVGEYLLDKARLVRSNLYVAAELFTGSEEMDRIFVERLGITSLIREAMQAWSVEELSQLVYRHGGRPIGSFSKQPVYRFEKFGSESQATHLVRSSSIHALFMDCTHDNLMPAQKRTVEDTLPNAALVSMCACAVGSVMGYDECYPKLLDIVSEKRQYTFGGGIGKIKKILSDVHTEMGQLNANETHVHHEGQYITVHRINSRTGEGWLLVARTKFGDEGYQRSM